MENNFRSTEPSTAKEDCHIGKSKADELYLETEKLSVKSSLIKTMKFPDGQVTSGHKLSEYYLHLLLYSLVKPSDTKGWGGGSSQPPKSFPK